MHIENTEIFNFKGAFRGMRNSMDSWDMSDSWFGIIDPLTDDGSDCDVVDAWIDEENIERRERGWEELSHDMENYGEYYTACEDYSTWLWNTGVLNMSSMEPFCEVAFLGPNDLDLAQRLVLAGDEQAKFMRQIFVSVDINAPIYWWKQFDQYKIGVTTNSTSTMHKLASTPIAADKFAFDGFDLIVAEGTAPHSSGWEYNFEDYVEDIVTMCEALRLKYVDTKNKAYWDALIQILPSAYLQKRTVTMSYANLRNIYFQRKNHKLKEWTVFCNWIKTLPYSTELITLGEKE